MDPIHLAVLDMDLEPYYTCGFKSRSIENGQNYQLNMVSCLSKMLFFSTFVGMIFGLLGSGLNIPDLHHH
jgi:hypothetical protein